MSQNFTCPTALHCRIDFSCPVPHHTLAKPRVTLKGVRRRMHLAGTISGMISTASSGPPESVSAPTSESPDLWKLVMPFCTFSSRPTWKGTFGTHGYTTVRHRRGSELLLPAPRPSGQASKPGDWRQPAVAGWDHGPDRVRVQRVPLHWWLFYHGGGEVRRGGRIGLIHPSWLHTPWRPSLGLRASRPSLSRAGGSMTEPSWRQMDSQH